MKTTMTFPSNMNNVRKSLIVEDSDFVWSFSRIKSFNDCKYGWWLRYIDDSETEDKFFAQFGTLIHDLLAKFYEGVLNKNELVSQYLCRFVREVSAPAPNQKVYSGYFSDGLDYLKSFVDEKRIVLGVEKEVNFSIEGIKFIGFIDLIIKDENGDIHIVDHKSRDLKPYSKRTKKTNSDKELDDYYKQLYLYSNAIKDEYGCYPTYLSFNCFRNKNYIKEQFHLEKLVETNRWAVDMVKKIKANTDWSPDYDWFKCTYICDLCKECEYYQINNS